MDDQLDRALLEERLVAVLSGAFGVVALLLTCVGLYGVMSYASARRTNAIGIRLALGASRRGVLGMVLASSLRLAAVGILLGAPMAVVAMRSVSAGLFGVGAADVPTMAATALLMLIVAALAGWMPARRATAVDPVVALRQD